MTKIKVSQVMHTFSSASDSLCGIGVIDRSLELLAGNSFISKKKVGKGFLVKIGFQLKGFFFSDYLHISAFIQILMPFLY